MACVHQKTLGGTLHCDVTGAMTAINGFVAITGLGPGGAKKIATHCAESDTETFIKGRKQAGSANFELNFSPDDTGHAALDGAAKAGTEINWEYHFAGSTKKVTFTGYIDAWPLDVPDDDIVKINATIVVNGDPVIA